MSVLIYFETNWIIGAVVGQDPRADELLASSVTEVELAIPSACLMEAVSAFDWKRIERNQLASELERQLKQVRRSNQLLLAQQLTAQLIQANITNAKLLDELFQRLDDFLTRVARRAELIPISTAAVEHMVQLHRDTDLDRDDALILACIFSHSTGQTSVPRAFLTGNVRDFDVEPVKTMIEGAGIKLFSSTDRLLQWAAANRPSS